MSLASYAYSGDFSHDIEKIVYSNAYRRLAHKTQIIVKPTRDHFRSRLIHSEEVNQIALALGRKLELNLELITAISKAHDLGHTPFGHAGEKTLQIILEREITSRFKVKNPKNVKKRQNKIEREDLGRKFFHHSLNSTRMLLKEKEYEGMSSQIINGVLTHSWSPWKKEKNKYSIPETYEAQVVAVADQIASINHDTEDIIEGEPYTEYNTEKFKDGLSEGFKKKYPEEHDKLRTEILSLIVNKTTEPGYGRSKRTELFINKISQDSIDNIRKNNVTTSEQAKIFPLYISKEWADFLNFYEEFIRELIQDRVSWFIARDNMAGALISTVFNHIWPRARASATINQMKIDVYEKSETVKTKHKEPTQYLDHFIEFFNDHYINEKENTNVYGQYLERMKKTDVRVWDINILDALDNPTADDQKMFTRLVAVVDFIAGLTDRYCLEMFNELYQDFVIT